MLQCGLSRQAVISCSAGHSDGGIFHLELHIDMIKFEGHVACYLGGQAVVSLSGGHPYGKASFTNLTRLKCNTNQINVKVQFALAVDRLMSLSSGDAFSYWDHNTDKVKP
jgi:hypothetical protein